MDKKCFYDVFLNEKKVATVGPSTLKQLHISFGITDGKPIVRASAISDKEPGLLYIDWLDESVNFDDSLRILLSKDNSASNPRLTKKLKRGIESTIEDSFCEFCKCSEKEVGRLIWLGDNAQICEECVNHCVDLFKTGE